MKEPPWERPPLVAISISTARKRLSGFQSLINKMKENSGAIVVPSVQIEEIPPNIDADLEEGELPCEEGELPCEEEELPCEKEELPCEKREISCEEGEVPCEEEIIQPDRVEEAKNSLKELPLGLANDEFTNGDLREEAPEEEKKQKKRKNGELQEQKPKPEKKKRVLTVERKKKKKARERIKRAEKERAMGVRRRPVFKQIEKPPKPPVPCKYFMKGRCSKGESCTFSHNQVPETKLYLCKYFLIGCCLKGDDCPFSHETSKFPCKYLITRGFCKDGDECKFSHKPVSDEERKKIIQRVVMEKQQQSANGEEVAKEGEKLKLDKTTDCPDYDPEWGDNAIDESTPMDQDSFLFRAAKQAAIQEIDGTLKQDSEYDPCPQDWWRDNSYSSSAPVSEDSFLARQAALQRDQNDGSPAYDPDFSPESSLVLGGGPSYSSSVQDSFLSRVAQEAAIKQFSQSSTVAPMPSICTSGLSVADQLQQAMRESGSIGIFF